MWKKHSIVHRPSSIVHRPESKSPDYNFSTCSSFGTWLDTDHMGVRKPQQKRGSKSAILSSLHDQHFCVVAHYQGWRNSTNQPAQSLCFLIFCCRLGWARLFTKGLVENSTNWVTVRASDSMIFVCHPRQLEERGSLWSHAGWFTHLSPSPKLRLGGL